ncbi:hypothetical protein FOZ63_006840 [Perkinsus olseni]|uniref:Uncharacterized protein n=1 Tax=Perkinsus olseni TaxID=32597 RepID=A0A7J6U2G2_PEROL|nr:hypothetical protein FOZ63_006840 [Perkinsus olseni]
MAGTAVEGVSMAEDPYTVVMEVSCFCRAVDCRLLSIVVGGGLYSGGYGYPGGLQGMGVPGQQDLWFTQTAESLGRFNQMLEMHTMFLDQIYHHCGMIYARTTDLVSWLRGVLNYVKSGKLEEKNIELILDRLGQSRQTPQEELAAIRRRVRVLSGFAVLLALWLLWKRRSRKGTRGASLQASWDAVLRNASV